MHSPWSQASIPKASPRGVDPSLTDRRSGRDTDRAQISAEERRKIEKELLNRKTTYGGKYRPFEPTTSGEQKSKEKLEIEEYKNKMRYKEFLLDLVEKKVRMRRFAQRQKKIDNLRRDY